MGYRYRHLSFLAEKRSQDAAHDLPAELAADGVGRAFGQRPHEHFRIGLGLLLGGGGRGLGSGLLGLRLQLLVGRFSVDGLFVGPENDGPLDDAGHLGGLKGCEAAVRRHHPGPLHHGGNAFLVLHGHEGLAHAKLQDGLGRVDFGVCPEGLGGGLHGLLVARREGPQGVLDAVSELTQDGVGDVEGVLRNEVDADPLGSDESHDLLDLVLEGLRDVFEEQVRLVEEEDEFGLRQIAHFGKLLEELREEPEQERGVDLGRLHQPVGHEDVDDPPALCVGLHEIVDVEGGLAEKLFAALLLDDEQIALDRPDAGLGDVSVLDLELVRVVPHVLRHGPAGP